MFDDFSIPIHIEELSGVARDGEAIRIGVPFPRGLIRETGNLVLSEAAGAQVAHQTRPLAWWSDRSIKWLLLDALVHLAPFETVTLGLGRSSSTSEGERRPVATVTATRRGSAIHIDTGAAHFEIPGDDPGPIGSVTVGGVEILEPRGARLRLVGRDGSIHQATIDRAAIEEAGPCVATVVTEGGFRGPRGGVPITFRCRTWFTAGSAAVRLELELRNPQAAVHPGGTWDLGDPGSWFFKEFALTLHPAGVVHSLRWYAEAADSEREQPESPWSIYQDSSGGDNWNSPNHIDHLSNPTVAFRGYRIDSGAAGATTRIGEGLRATPGLTVKTAGTWVAAGMMDFWQNFPSALRWQDGVLSVAVFPAESSRLFELQGGERKRQWVLLDFGSSSQRPRIAALQQPIAVSIDPPSVEASGAIPWFTARAADDHARYAGYIDQIIEGPHAFTAKRETIDEYGWRNFGDLYADHEAVHHTGARPFVSHYNNQYDFIYGAFVHFMRTGDARWRRLLGDAARHMVDIDIYHTQRDKSAFNGGLFWHTDHYLPAATCTHRTYSRHNGPQGRYGGGPSNEHDYTTGLLYYYYLSGDEHAADAVRELADWVVNMDDGRRTLFALIDSHPTGAASKTLEPTFHRPGRGAGNSINALLDAYLLSRQRKYLLKAEEIIQRCVHPADDIELLQLGDPEHRWSYLVFLQVLGKYLDSKREMGEFDYGFHYGRESLLHYASWMLENELPFKDVLHKVELPTETWPAHDVRKSHVLYMAAEYAGCPQRNRLREKAAFFFERCLGDLLEFSTAYVTRPLVILCVYGPVQDYFRKRLPAESAAATHNYDFGLPSVFQPQRARLKAALESKWQVLSVEASRVAKEQWSLMRTRLPGSR